jgi:hypothetical protein
MVRRALDRLPEKYRHPIWLHHYEGLPFGEMSTALAVPEGTLRSHASRGLERLRQDLARSGTSVPAAAVVTALTSQPAETAPKTLLDGIDDLVGGIGRSVPAGAVAGTVTRARIAAAVVALVVVGSGAGTLWWNVQSRRKEAPRAPAVVAEPGTVDFHCDFNSPGLPEELKVLSGRWHHLPKGGPDGSGCIQSDDDLFYLLADIPIDRLPVLVSYRTTFVLPKPAIGGWMSNAWWSEYRSAAEYNGLSKTYESTVAKGTDHSSRWVTRREYVTDRFVYRWHDWGHCELTIYDRAPGSRLMVSWKGRHRIDDLTIRSIDPASVPDASRFLAAYDAIPADGRKGIRIMPQFKPGRPPRPVTLRFDGPRSPLKEALAARRADR